MALAVTDLFIVERAEVQYKMTANQIADFVGAIRDFTVADIAARNLLVGLKVGDRVFVTNATGDSTVASGWAVYRVSSIGPIVYQKIQEQESMDFIITSHNPASAGLTPQSNPIVVNASTQAITFNITQLTALP
jgi:hypothetical protein